MQTFERKDDIKNMKKVKEGFKNGTLAERKKGNFKKYNPPFYISTFIDDFPICFD